MNYIIPDYTDIINYHLQDIKKAMNTELVYNILNFMGISLHILITNYLNLLNQ